MYYREMMAGIHAGSIFGVATALLKLASIGADQVPKPSEVSFTVVDIWGALFWADPVGVLWFFAMAGLFLVTRPDVGGWSR